MVVYLSFLDREPSMFLYCKKSQAKKTDSILIIKHIFVILIKKISKTMIQELDLFQSLLCTSQKKRYIDHELFGFKETDSIEGSFLLDALLISQGHIFACLIKNKELFNLTKDAPSEEILDYIRENNLFKVHRFEAELIAKEKSISFEKALMQTETYQYDSDNIDDIIKNHILYERKN